MTQTEPAQPRHAVDSITSDQLDQLYAQLAIAEAKVAELDRAGDVALSAVRLMQQTEKRAKRAEAAIERVRAELDRIAALPTIAYDDGRADTFPVGARWAIRILRENALGEPQNLPPGKPRVHIGDRANAEDCPGCSGTNLPYPFICPGQPGEPAALAAPSDQTSA